jgi:hypothetical protein
LTLLNHLCCSVEHTVDSRQRVVETLLADQDIHTGDRLNHSMIIRTLFSMGVFFALVLGCYAQFPGESVPGMKVVHKENVRHKGTPKQLSAKRKIASRTDEQTAHKLRRFVSEFVSASGSRNANGDQSRFFAKRANYLGKPNLSRTAIGATITRFDTFWPKRKYIAKGKPVIAGPFGRDHYSVKCSFAWALADGPWASKGVGVLHFRIRRVAAKQFEILSMIEKVDPSRCSARYSGHGYS